MPMSRRSGGTKPPGGDDDASPSSIVPASGRSRPAMQRRVVVLPQPRGPEERVELALLDVEADPVDREDPAALALVLVVQGLDVDADQSITL